MTPSPDHLKELEITPRGLKQRLDAGEKIHLVDCREPYEYQLAHIDGCELIPMRSVPANLPHLKGKAEESPVVVYCHHGMRSLQVVNWLREQGVACQSMSGGIDQWSSEIDPAIPRYS